MNEVQNTEKDHPEMTFKKGKFNTQSAKIYFSHVMRVKKAVSGMTEKRRMGRMLG